MKKETVVLFDGESDFILPKNQKYDRRKGKSTFVGQDGVSEKEPSKPAVSTQPVPPQAAPTSSSGSVAVPTPPAGGKVDAPTPPAGVQGKAPVVIEQPPADTGDINKPINSDTPPSGGQTGSGTGSYTNYSVGKFSMPDPTSPNFCENVNEFILTNGGGIATPPEITAARAAIAKYCTGTPPANPDPGTGSPRTGGGNPPADTPPADTTPKDTPPADTPPADSGGWGLGKTPGGKLIIPKPEGLPTEPKVPKVDMPPVDETLGKPPDTTIIPLNIAPTGGGAMGGGGGGGGAEEEQPPVEQKKSYWWILFVAAAVAGGIYYYRRKK